MVNEKGLDRALATPGVTTIGYPYSISAYFRRANANMSRAGDRARWWRRFSAATKAADRDLVVYISMAFGNPYDEPWGPEIVEDTLVWLKDIGVRTVSLADTIGTASPDEVAELYRALRALSLEWNWECICTAGRKRPAKKSWLLTKPVAGVSMAR